MPEGTRALQAYLINLAAANAAATVSGISGQGACGFSLSGTWSGTVTFEGTMDGTNWFPMLVTNPAYTSQATTATANGIFFGNCAGMQAVRARMSTYTSGTAVAIVSVGQGDAQIQSAVAVSGSGLDASSATNNTVVGTTSVAIKATPGRVFYVTVTTAYTGGPPELTDGNGGNIIFVVPLAPGTYPVNGVFLTSIYFQDNGAAAGAATIGWS